MQSITEKWNGLKRLVDRLQEATIIIPVAVISLGLFSHLMLQAKVKNALANEEANGILGNEAALASAIIAVENRNAAALENAGSPNEEPPPEEDGAQGFIIVDDSALLNTGNPLSTNIVHRDGLIIYKIQKGDTLSSIAANFGISLNTVYWANSGIKSNSLRLGQEIIILPVTGIIHQAQTGETLDTIAALYEIPEARIAKYNSRILARGLSAGTNLIVPGAKPKETGGKIASSLPNFPGYYALPSTGWNWGKLHNFNAVDIANACGTPIYAAAEGLVVEVKSGGWNEGYGSYIILEHPNNTRTRYAHNQRNVVSVGDYVLQGDTIGYIGNTGRTHGPTGCHVHFEIMGGRNPFAK
jgi:murein DD-endopeptidase MepM/ murein hydrolase activator NlpD